MDMPIGTDFSGWVQAGPYLYISGGFLSGSSSTDATQRYDMATDLWDVASATLPASMGTSGLVINGQKLYNLGGSTDFVYAPLDQVLVMDLAEWPDGEWEPYYDFLPFANGGMAPFCSEGKTGGEIWSVGWGYSDEYGNAYIYDTNLYHPTGEPCVHYDVDLPAPMQGYGEIRQLSQLQPLHHQHRHHHRLLLLDHLHHLAIQRNPGWTWSGRTR